MSSEKVNLVETKVENDENKAPSVLTKEKEGDTQAAAVVAVTAASKNSKSSSNDCVFTLKRWNLVAMWSWDVECEVCAICRTPLMDSCLKCQTDNKNEDCVVVWGDCNHSFHNCCMLQWIKNRNLCPLCQSEWRVSRVGR